MPDSSTREGLAPTQQSRQLAPATRADAAAYPVREPSERFQILSLDGGGLKGLFSAAVLARVEEKTGRRIVDHFDLIAGTSTGGLIAIGLGLGLSPRELVNFYVNEGRRVFRGRFGWRSIRQLLRPKYPGRRLAAALKSPKVFGEAFFGDSSKRLVIPSYNLSTNRVRVFRTPHIPQLTTDYRIPAWQVGMATASAPTYFPSFELNNTHLIDGGVWANNPVLSALAEAVGPLRQAPGTLGVLSLSTTSARQDPRRRLRLGGFGQWMWGGAVADVLMSAQSVGATGIASHLVGKENLLRVDAIVPANVHMLDHVTTDDLLAEAEQTALYLVPELSERFLPHDAATYEPCHRTGASHAA